MELLTRTEATERLGVRDLTADLIISESNGLTSKTFYLPSHTVDQTILAKTIGKAIASRGSSYLHITYWSNDSDSNQQLIYGYRRGLGDGRSLAEAAVHRFAVNEDASLASVLSLVIYFGWDARILNAELTYQLSVNNDGFLDLDTTEDTHEELWQAVSQLRAMEPAA